ncbi:MAG: hypothetical protein HYZ81_21020 [Nitrospinae bacterium]|nr:hypothetical protein [Nitrospinota bacterium]
MDLQAINEAERLGFGRLRGSIVHRIFAFALPLEPYPHNPEAARRLLAEPAVGITPLFYFPVPYEEMRLKE